MHGVPEPAHGHGRTLDDAVSPHEGEVAVQRRVYGAYLLVGPREDEVGVVLQKRIDAASGATFTSTARTVLIVSSV